MKVAADYHREDALSRNSRYCHNTERSIGESTVTHKPNHSGRVSDFAATRNTVISAKAQADKSTFLRVRVICSYVNLWGVLAGSFLLRTGFIVNQQGCWFVFG